MTPAGGTTAGQNVVHPVVAGATGAAHADNPGVGRHEAGLRAARRGREGCLVSAGGAVGAAAVGAARGCMGVEGVVPLAPRLHAEKTASAVTDKVADNAIAR